MAKLNLHQRVEEAFRTTLVPTLQATGLDFKLAGVDADGVVQVYLQGACHSCPSSAMSMIMSIERELLEQVPEVAYIELTPEP